MLKRLIALLILAAGVVLAQTTTTTVTGTVSGLDGVPATSGQVLFDLKPSTDSTISGVTRFTPQTVVCGIDGTGALKNQSLSGACVVVKNSALSPVGTFYRVTFCPQNACGASMNFYAINDSTDITTVVPTPGTSPANMFLDLMSTQVITGAKTFNNAANSFSGTFAGTIAASSVTSSSTISSVGNATVGGTITAGSAAHTITTAAGLLDLAQTSGTINLATQVTGNLASGHGGIGALTTGNASGNVPISNGTLSTNLNADLFEGRHLLVFSATQSPLAVAAASCATQVFTVTGIVAGDSIINSNPKAGFQAGLSTPSAIVSGNNQVTQQFCNPTAGSITPTASETYTYIVLR